MRKVLLWVCSLLLIVFISFKLINFINEGMFYINKKQSAGHLARVAMQAQASIPMNACVETSFSKQAPSLEAGTLKYYLYPIKVKDVWQNQFNQNNKACDTGYFININKPVTNSFKNPRLSGDLFKSFAFHGLTLVTGVFLFFTLFPQGMALLNCWQVLSTCFLLGVAIITMFFLLLTAAGMKLTIITTSGGLLLIVLISYGWLLMRKGRIVFNQGVRSFSLNEFLLRAITVFLMIFCLMYTLALPIGIWDEVIIWLLKAKMFFISQGFIFDYTEFTNNYYPLMWPLNITVQYVLMGGVFEQAAKWTSAFMFLCLLGQLSIIAKCLGLNAKWQKIAICLFIVLFNHWTFFTALPENIYIAFTVMAVAFCLLWMQQDRNAKLGVVLIALWALSCIKFEGFLTGIFLFLAYLISNPNVFRDKKKIMKVSLLLSSVIVYGLWMWWLTHNHIPFKMFHVQGGFSLNNIEGLGEMLFKQMANGGVIYGVVFVAMLILNRRLSWPRPQVLVIIFSFILLLFSLFAGVCWPHQEFLRYYPEVLTRLFSRVSCFLMVIWLWGIVKLLGNENNVKNKPSC